MNAQTVNDVLGLFNSGNFEAVLSKQAEVEIHCCESSLAWTVMGASSLSLNAPERAVYFFERAIECDPGNAVSYSNLGAAHRQAGNIDQAIEAFQRSISIRPEYADAHYNLAGAYKEKGCLENSVSAYEAAIRHDPRHKLSYTNLGSIFLEMGALGSAIDCYRKAVSIDPDYAEGHYNLGLAADRLGQTKEAIKSFQRAIKLKDDYAEAYDNLGLALLSEGDVEAAIASHRCALKLRPDYAEAYNNLAIALQKKGNFEEAQASCHRALEIRPEYPEALNNLGIVLENRERADDAILAFKRALGIKPDYADALSNLGSVLQSQGRLDEAISSFKRALKIRPDCVDLCNSLGIALAKHGDLEEALACWRKALKLNPDFVEAYNNMGNALQMESRFDEAISLYGQAIAARPEYSDAHANLGSALHSQGRHEEAIVSLRRALEIGPDLSSAHYKLGNALTHLGRLDEAIDALQRALEIKPDSVEVRNDLGIALIRRGDTDGALACWREAAQLRPDFVEAYNNLGNALQGLGRSDEAISAYEKALEIRPDFSEAEAQMRYQRRQICDWRDNGQMEGICARLAEHSGKVASFAMLPLVDDPELQLRFSRKYAAHSFNQRPLPLPARPKTRPDRLRIGYFSADFREHPVSVLMTGILRGHDRSQFEVHAYGYGPAGYDEWRERVARSVDSFVDVTQHSDGEIVDLARANGLDIAIDLNGYTTHSRSEVFQYRLAPVQINFLGYPSTTGADFIDYIIADPTVIPGDQRACFTERVIYLPHCYQPNDDTREIAETATTRADVGLPEDGFVFCCFNNSYKISPSEFDIWMRVLRQVDCSVLWLAQPNPWAQSNLCREAAARGVDPARIVFAERTPALAMHMARHKHADLFLDTFNYNAHTTASDALWAGVPVVTKAGKQFAARVAASQLKAIGLPELITQSERDYEALILELAEDPVKLADIRAKLAANRLAEPLFDTRRYIRNYESGLRRAYDIYHAGKRPEDIWVREGETRAQ